MRIVDRDALKIERLEGIAESFEALVITGARLQLEVG